MTRVALVFALLACGCSRSWLLEGDAVASGGAEVGAGTGGVASTSSSASGAGGAGAGGNSTSSASSPASVASGVGGSSPLCTQLTLEGPPVAIPTLGPGTADNPRFHFLDADRVAVVHRPFDSVLGLRIGSTTVTWTGAWPPPAEPPVELLGQVGLSFAVDRGPDPRLGVLASPSEQLGMWLDVVDPAVGGWKQNLAIDGSADRAVFLRRKGEEFMTATVSPGMSSFGAFYQLRVAWFDGATLRGPFNAGCSAGAVMADALPTSKGWLLARTSPSASTCSPFAPPPPPQAITVDGIVNDMPVAGAEIPFGGQTQQVVLARRQGGAWLLYWAGSKTLMGIALTELGQIAGGPVPLATVTESSFAFAADQLDDGLAILVYDAPSAGPTALHVFVKDAFANTLAVGTIASPPKLTTPPQLAFDPATRNVLVGYAAVQAGKQATYLARFACP
jgi:hypothetical protein